MLTTAKRFLLCQCTFRLAALQLGLFQSYTMAHKPEKDSCGFPSLPLNTSALLYSNRSHGKHGERENRYCFIRLVCGGFWPKEDDLSMLYIIALKQLHLMRCGVNAANWCSFSLEIDRSPVYAFGGEIKQQRKFP